MLKIEKEYQEKYGNIPSGSCERMDYLLSNIHILQHFKGFTLDLVVAE